MLCVLYYVAFTFMICGKSPQPPEEEIKVDYMCVVYVAPRASELLLAQPTANKYARAFYIDTRTRIIYVQNKSE